MMPACSLRLANNIACRYDRDARAKAVLAVLVAVLCAWFHSPAQAAAKPASEQVYDFDIPRTSRVQAIQELSRQAGGLLLGYLSNDTVEEQALVGPVKGRQTVEDALRVILRSAMLTFRWVEKDILSVEPIKLKQSVAVEDELLHWSDTRWREEITVVAWALRDLKLSVAPAVIVERERLDAIGAPTLAEALRYISQSAYTRPEGSRISGAQYAEMRGLGPDTALILINNRRALPSANSITSSAFDLNTIPITAVERIEFLLDSGAAAYGTDAIGGIINIVLRKNVPDPTVELRYGGADGGAEQKRITFSGGLDSERFHSALVLDYFDLSGLLGSERALWRDQDYRRFGGRDQRSRMSSPGNISSVTPGNLPGLSSPIAAVPLTDSTSGVSIDDFRVTAGTSNLESMFNYWSVVPEATRASVVATSSFDFTERLAASAELLYVDRNAAFYFAPPLLPGMPVPASNAYNPFGVPVLSTRMLTDFGAQYQTVESDLFRFVGALNGRWRGWDWELSGLYSDEDAATWLTNEVDPLPLMAALASPDPTRALNLFQSGPIGSPELLNSLRAPRHVDQFASTGKQVAGYLSGQPASLWAGPIRAMVGGEWRRESAVFGSRTVGFDAERDIAAAFAQVHVPLIDLAMDVPMVSELSFSAGSRWDDYENIGGGIRSQYGFLWKPQAHVTVRASQARSFRPPSLYELYLPDIETITRISDPARGNEPASVLLSSGGNSELDPVTAKTLTAGIEYSPDTAMNWTVSADYWRIKMDDRVLLLSPILLLANESLFRDRIDRAAPTDAESAAGLPGRLVSIDSSRVNVGSVKASGIDFTLRADVQTGAGRFTPELLATWFDTYTSTDLPSRPAEERVNLASEIGTILEWRAILSLGWHRGPFGITSAARYTPSYNDAVAGVRADRKVASQTLVDLQGSVDFGRWFGGSSHWSGFKLAVGATNLFDAEPSFALVGDAAGFDMSQGDLKQRSYYLRLEKSFTR
jgi:iron complex outermembrane recepter protein